MLKIYVSENTSLKVTSRYLATSVKTKTVSQFGCFENFTAIYELFDITVSIDKKGSSQTVNSNEIAKLLLLYHSKIHYHIFLNYFFNIDFFTNFY